MWQSLEEQGGTEEGQSRDRGDVVGPGDHYSMKEPV